MLLIFLGLPGSGKGTISSKMVKEYKFNHISTGEIFRKEISDKTELGIKLKKLIESGHLVDDSITWEIAKNSLEKKDINNENIILDGYPRNINQFKLLENWINENNFLKPKLIYFEVSESEILKRLTGRIMCKKCGSTYHKFFLPPIKENICDLDETELLQREDDKIDNVKIRINEYKNATEPLIKYYDEQKILKTINGEASFEFIINEILKFANEK